MEATAISFEDAVKKAYNRNGNLKGYLGYFAYDTNSTILFDDKRVWEFRYKMQYEEPRVKVIQQVVSRNRIHTSISGLILSALVSTVPGTDRSLYIHTCNH
jgi:hypothetical protein